MKLEINRDLARMRSLAFDLLERDAVPTTNYGEFADFGAGEDDKFDSAVYRGSVYEPEGESGTLVELGSTIDKYEGGVVYLNIALLRELTDFSLLADSVVTRVMSRRLFAFEDNELRTVADMRLFNRDDKPAAFMMNVRDIDVEIPRPKFARWTRPNPIIKDKDPRMDVVDRSVQDMLGMLASLKPEHRIHS